MTRYALTAGSAGRLIVLASLLAVAACTEAPNTGTEPAPSPSQTRNDSPEPGRRKHLHARRVYY